MEKNMQEEIKGSEIRKKFVNIENYPSINPRLDNHQYIIGDLHGNALKLLYFLIHEGFMTLPADNYKKIVTLYNRHSALLAQNNIKQLKSDIIEFNQLLSSATFHAGNSTIIGIGDETADRGENDYFTLKIIQLLDNAHVSFDFLLSNHSIELLYDQLNTIPRYQSSLGDQQAKSLFNLGKLIRTGVVTQEEIFTLVEHHYKAHLRLLNYTTNHEEDPTRITLYTHAPAGLETVKKIAEICKIRYQDFSIDALSNTINQINQYWINHMDDVIKQCLNEKQKITNMILGKNVIPHDHYPFTRLIWNRASNDHSIVTQANYSLHFINGHEGEIQHPHLPNHFNIDTNLGRPDCHQGLYYMMRTDNKPAPKLPGYTPHLNQRLDSFHQANYQNTLNVLKHKKMLSYLGWTLLGSLLMLSAVFTLGVTGIIAGGFIAGFTALGSLFGLTGIAATTLGTGLSIVGGTLLGSSFNAINEAPSPLPPTPTHRPGNENHNQSTRSILRLRNHPQNKQTIPNPSRSRLALNPASLQYQRARLFSYSLPQQPNHPHQEEEKVAHHTRPYHLPKSPRQ